MLLHMMLAVLGILSADGSVGPAPAYWVYIGTYTKPGGSAGIYRSRLDVATGKLGAPELAAEMTNPSFLATNPTGQVMYAVGEVDGADGGAVCEFHIDRRSGALLRTGQTTSGGDGPCHISIHPDGNYVIVANYGGGSTAIIRARPTFGERIALVQHGATEPKSPGIGPPRAHCGFFLPDGQPYALVADLALDIIKVLAFDASRGVVDDAGAADIVLPAGTGPRHIAIAADGKFAYVCGEKNSTVNVIRLDLANNKSEVAQSLSTLTESVRGNSTAECILHPSGKFVYVSNRGHDSVAVFRVNEDHGLTAVGHIKGRIKTPRGFAVDPTGKWMLIANQRGDRIGVFAIDQKTGLASETDSSIEVSQPVCIRFAPVAE